MYARLVSSGVGGSTGTIAAMNNLRGVMAGTITSTAQLNSNGHNQGTSYIGGTLPTTGIYTVGTTSTSTSYNGVASFTTTKFHYAKGQASGYTPARQIYINADRDYGWRVTVYDQQYTNAFPYPNTSHYFSSYSNTSYQYSIIPPYNNQPPSGWKEMHLIMNDTTFAFQIISGGTSTQADYGTFVVCDLEYSPSIDPQAFTGNNKYCPTVSSWWAWMNVMEQGDSAAAGAGSNNAWHGVCNQQYIDQYGTYRNTELSDSSNDHFGYHTTGKTNRPMLEPRPRNNILPMVGSGGSNLHQLVPMTYVGHMDDTDGYGDPRRGRLMHWYRTTNDVGFSGDIITENGTNYRVFRVHKTGDESMIDATNNACYAFPENNVAYSGN